MSEKEAVKKVGRPNTKASLTEDLKALGIRAGDLVITHASLSSLGWVVGREVSVLDALLDVLGPDGTIIMPSQSGDNSMPEHWENPPVPETWFEIIKANMPPYDPKRTPVRAMGKIVEALLNYPGVLRSNHPQVSFCGYGPLAEKILSNHALSPGLGDGSPLRKLYDNHAKILLLGVGYGNCTSLHLPESHLDHVQWQKNGASMLVKGKAEWVEFDEIVYDDEDFARLGEDYEKEHTVNKHQIGAALCRCIDMRDLCDFADEWFQIHRK